MSFFSPKPKPAPKPVDEPPKKVPLAMPNVFVVPPEEDQTPPWCFFHAEHPELSQVDEQPESMDHSSLFDLNPDSPPPTFSRESMMEPMSGRNFETISIVDALLSNRENADDSGSETSFEGDMDAEEEDDDDVDSIQESDRRELPSRDQEHEPANDSDVIEVVKVSRRKSLAEETREDQNVRAFSQFKRSGTLKSRASKVFRSLRGTLRSKPRAQDIFPPPVPTRKASQNVRKAEPSERESLPRPKSPTISRMRSGVLSQLFTGPSVKSRSSISSFHEKSSVTETDKIQSPPASPQSSHFGSIPLSRRTSTYTLERQQDEARLRTASPTPTFSSKSTNRRRSFSIMRLFSSSSSSSSTTSAAPTSSITSASNSYDDSGRATPTQHSNSSTPSATSSISTVSSPQPQTPTSAEITPVRLVTRDEPTEPPILGNFDSIFETNIGLNLGLGLSLDDSNESSVSSRQTAATKSEQTVDRFSSQISRKSHEDPADMSLEMRLDSFHFDDLSFDANRF